MKNLWNKIVAWLFVKWTAIKTWFITKPLSWLKKNWFIVVNYIVIVLSYNNVYNKDGVGLANILLGLWIFTSIAYAGWKWFIKK